MKQIILVSDHGGFELKEKIKAHLMQHGIKVQDTSATDVDYPILAKRGVELVKHHDTQGIFLCGSGVGICIAANRYKGIRAALVHSQIYAQLARQHNDANILCLGGRFLEPDEALKIVEIFLQTPFVGERHSRRVELIDTLS